MNTLTIPKIEIKEQIDTMKAVLFPKVSEVTVCEVEKPILNAGEALIKVDYCGICGSDIHVLNGHHPTATFPVIPGHEFVGTLEEICGDNPQDLKIGDTVVAQPFFSCGCCEPCANGHDNVCKNLSFMGAHRSGGFSEYVRVLTRKTYKLPSDFDKELASLIEPIAVAVHDVRRSELKVGENALVIGGGPIGILIALVARHSGARDVVISEISEYRRKFIEELGFKAVNPLDDNFKEQIDPKNQKFNVVFEVSGTQPGISTAIEFCKISGKIVVVGMASKEHNVNLAQVFAKELRLEGVRIHAQYNFLGAIDLLLDGALNSEFKKLVSKVYDLKDAKEAFSYSQSGTDFFKVLIKM